MDDVLGTLSELSCEKYIDNRKKTDFTDPICTVVLKGVEDYNLSIYKKSEEKNTSYPAVSSENEYPFLLYERDAKEIMKKQEEYFKTAD